MPLAAVTVNRWVSTDGHDKALAAFAGELLALAGAWEPSAISLKPLCAASSKLPSTEQSEATPAGSSTGSAGNTSAYVSMVVASLQLMATYLVDPEVLVIKSAQFTLRHLLASAAGKEALAHLDPVTQSYLQVHALLRVVSPSVTNMFMTVSSAHSAGCMRVACLCTASDVYS